MARTGENGDRCCWVHSHLCYAPSTVDDNEKQEDPSGKQNGASVAATDIGAGMTVETPKVSMMAKVGTNIRIPKNKALVPVTQTTTKWEPSKPKKGEPPVEKTKWGPNLIEDSVVKFRPALALQSLTNTSMVLALWMTTMSS